MKSVYIKNMLGTLGYSNEHFSENYSVQIDGTSAIRFDYVAFSDRYLKDVSTSCIAVQEVIDDNEETKYLDGAKYLATPIVIISKNRHFVKESPKKVMTVCAIPFGIALTILIKKKSKSFMKVN